MRSASASQRLWIQKSQESQPTMFLSDGHHTYADCDHRSFDRWERSNCCRKNRADTMQTNKNWRVQRSSQNKRKSHAQETYISNSIHSSWTDMKRCQVCTMDIVTQTLPSLHSTILYRHIRSMCCSFQLSRKFLGRQHT